MQAMLVPQFFIGIFFIVTGIFLFRKKEWARKAVIYFSLFTAGILCIGALLKPGAIGQILLNVIHPGICIWYLTGKTAVAWFDGTGPDQPQDPKCCT